MSHLHLLPDEYVIVELRRHPLVVFFDLLLFGFLMLIPLIIYAFIYLGNIAISDYPVVMAFVVLATSIYYLYIWLFTLHSLMDYVLDIWVITNERIIDMEQKGLFSMSLSEQEIHRIQDMTAEVNGILPTLFNYGNVYIQTAGEKERFIFKQVRNPKGVVQILSHLLEESRERNNETDPQ
ncbi:MAG: PH domain-containing protein [Patescibacteria group bacterium]